MMTKRVTFVCISNSVIESKKVEEKRGSMVMMVAALVMMMMMVSDSNSENGCKEEVVSFSTCLSYVSSPPNNLTDEPSFNCCNSLHFESLCLCHLLRDPNLLGFPLNTTSLLSLSSLCHLLSPPLNLLCSASQSLPPFNTPSHAPGGGGEGSSGRMEPSSSVGMGAGTASHIPILNGAVVAAPSTNINTLLLFQILLVTVTTLLNNTQ